jgi:hypothetical protein
MKLDELQNKDIDVTISQLHLLIDNNAYLRTILDVLIETNQLNKKETFDKLSHFREDSLELLKTLDRD